MGRRPCCAKEGLNRGAWSAREDNILINYIKVHGEGKWRDVPQRAGLKRCGKSCRLRWLNYLRPDIKRGNISVEEEELIIRLHKLLGNRWSLIAGRLPGRTDNEIKNYWNTNLSKRVEDNKITRSSKNQVDNFKEMICTKNPLRELKTGTTTESNKVIRTKAVRCTKVVIPHHQCGNHINMTDKNIECGESPSSSALQEENSSDDLLIDFNIDEFFLEEALNSDQTKEINECDDNAVGTEYGLNSTQCLNFPASAHENILMDDVRPENWSPRYLFQPNEDLDFKSSLATFVSPEEKRIIGE